MFEFEGATHTQIVVRHRFDAHRWRFSVGIDPRRKIRIITSGVGSHNRSMDGRAADVMEALQFASREARARNLID